MQPGLHNHSGTRRLLCCCSSMELAGCKDQPFRMKADQQPVSYGFCKCKVFGLCVSSGFIGARCYQAHRRGFTCNWIAFSAVTRLQQSVVQSYFFVGPAGPSHVHMARLPARKQTRHRLQAVAVQEVCTPTHEKSPELLSASPSSWNSSMQDGNALAHW